MRFTPFLARLSLLVGCTLGVPHPNRPCKQYSKAVSKLNECTTASRFCSSYLDLKQPHSHPFTKTFFTTKTITQASPTVTSTATVIRTVTSSTSGGCPDPTKLRKRTKSTNTPSCGIGSKTQSETISGACSCFLATSTTSTKTSTITVGSASTVTVTSADPSTTVTLYNYLQNSGFEDHADSIQPWTPNYIGQQSNNPPPQLVSPGAYGNSSTAVGLQTSGSGNYAYRQVTQNVQVCPGQDYLLTMSYKIGSGSEDTYLDMNLKTDQDRYVGGNANSYTVIGFPAAQKDSTGADLGPWQTISYVVNSGKETSVWVALVLEIGGDNSINTAYFDDVSLVPMNYKSSPPNGDFETGSIMFWNPFIPDAVNSGHVTTASPGKNSDYAMLLISSDASLPDGFVIVQTSLGAIAGATYRLSFSYFRYANSTGLSRLWVFAQNTDRDSTRVYALSFKDHEDDNHGGSVGQWNTVDFSFVPVDGTRTGASQSVADLVFRIQNGDDDGNETDNDGLSVAIDNISWILDGF